MYKDEDGRWIINNPEYGRFDGVIAAIGTCGDPNMPTLPGQEHFKGEVWHSSQLDGKSAKDKKVVIIGGGVSAVEALEFVAATHAEHTTVLARSEKWIISRNPFVDILLALSIFGSETIFSWIPEGILRLFFDRDLYDLSPPRNSGKGILTETPMVNSAVLDMIHRQSQLALGRHKPLLPLRNQPLLHAARTGRPQKRAKQREAHRRRNRHHGHRLQTPFDLLPPRQGLR